ncbi:TPA: M23 family metallopeptidase [Bacillus wiedmannii]|uniref:M23 family metallopeptidase n=1 Tax=Bacillus wiedmannii TaxID=1890302 RepID=UPI000BF52D58|nr:M23 family metallopeptidase [Bacillus wiedmannii]PEP54012.1 peptidase M23 [Bacillus wiedmannii]HDX9652500.1 M23 family metallopeptidase [Bacillus wiedmannii]
MAKFIYPTDITRVTSGFRGSRPDHHGIDLAESGYHPIYAAASGKVSRSYLSSSYGECIMIMHTIDGATWETVYAHMRSGSRTVKEGDYVTQGQTIGVMGETGQAYGQHLHFEMHKGGWNINKSNAVNPLDYLGKGDGGNNGNGTDPTDVDTRKNVSLPPDWQTKMIGTITVTVPGAPVLTKPDVNSAWVGRVPKNSGHVLLGWSHDGSHFWYEIAVNNWIREDVCVINDDGKRSSGGIYVNASNVRIHEGANTNDKVVGSVSWALLDVDNRYNDWLHVTQPWGWIKKEDYVKWVR